MNRNSLLIIGVLLVILLAFVMGIRSSGAQDWPSKPIQIIVGFPPGGSTDLVSRALGESISRTLATPVIIENKPGGPGTLALGIVAKAKPDGYTLGPASCSAFTEKPFFMKLPFDPVNGFTFICQVFNYGYGFVVRSDAPWKTFPEFVEAAKKQPGKISVSMSGLGSTMHVALAKLEQKIPGFKLKPVPFKGGMEAVTALMGGHVDSCFQTQEWKPFVDSGKLRLLAVPAKERLNDYPNVPTWLDLGYGVYGESPGAYLAPAGLSEKIREKLEQTFKSGMEDPAFKTAIKNFSLVESYKPGKVIYAELMKMYEENKIIIPKLKITEN